MSTLNHTLDLPVPVAAHAHRWKVLSIGVAANTSFSAAAAGIPTTAVWLRSGYHLSNPELGALLGAIGLGLALSELPWGMLTDRLGERPVLIGGLLGTAVTLLAMTLFLVPSPHHVPSLIWLMGAMTFTGVLGGSVNGASGRAVMAWFAEGERGLAMSIRQTAVPLGGGIGALLLPFLAAHYGFAAVYGALAVMCAASALFAARWLHQPPGTPITSHAAAAPIRHRPTVSPLRDAQIWRVVMGIGILCGPQFALLTFGTVFLHDFARSGMAMITTTMVSLQVGAMVMRIWSGRFTDRHGNRRAYMRASTVVAAVSFFTLASSLLLPVPPVLIAIEVAIVGICISAWHGVAYTELATLAGAGRAGTALGMVNTGVYAGLFLVPLTIPHILAATSWSTVWGLAGLCSLIAYPLFPRHK